MVRFPLRKYILKILYIFLNIVYIKIVKDIIRYETEFVNLNIIK